MKSLFIMWTLAIQVFANNPNRPNVVLILVDDFGRELIGSLGGESYPTPHIDQLAADGMSFDICYATPMCSPTRNMLLSGKYNFRNYTSWEKYDFDTQPTIANTLSSVGYRTAVSGKWHLGGWDKKPFGPTRAGFSQYATFNYPGQLDEDAQGVGNFFWNTHLQINGREERLGSSFSPARFRDFSLRFIKESAQSDQPFFLYYPMILAHRPFMPTDLTEKSGEKFRGRVGAVENFPDYVRYVDQTVGALRKMLKETKQSENTLFIFTADNGTDNVQEAKTLRSRWKGRSLKGGKYRPTELGANVPLLIVWPGSIAPGRTYSRPVDLTDFHLTLAKLAGAKHPDHLDGHDLTPALKGTGNSSRQFAYTWGVHQYSSKKYKDPQKYREQLLHIIRDDRWKYQSNGLLWDLKNGWPQGEPLPSKAHPKVRQRLSTALDTLRNSKPKRW